MSSVYSITSRLRTLVAAIAVVLGSPVTSAATEPILDQFYFGPPGISASGQLNECCRRVGQTFTAGISGRLAGVSVDIYEVKDYPLKVSICSTINGRPGPTLAETMLPTAFSHLSDIITFDVPANVIAGELYAIVVEYPSAPPPGAGQVVGQWGGGGGNEYPGGEAHHQLRGIWRKSGWDAFFATYVEPNNNPDCSGAVVADATLWPPDKTFRSVTISGISDPDGDPVTVTVTGVTQDEAVQDPRSSTAPSGVPLLDTQTLSLAPSGSPSAGPYCPDAIITNGVAQLRAERMGTGNGRVYAVSFTASDGRGGQCSGVVNVCVPHDMGHGSVCVDDGQSVNSLGPCGGNQEITAVEQTSSFTIRALPSQGRTASIEYSLPEAGELTLSLYDLAGRSVRTLESGARPSGTQRLDWDTNGLPRGMYFYRLRTKTGVLSAPVAILH